MRLLYDHEQQRKLPKLKEYAVKHQNHFLMEDVEMEAVYEQGAVYIVAGVVTNYNMRNCSLHPFHYEVIVVVCYHPLP